jgi:hypothetical protein
MLIKFVVALAGVNFNKVSPAVDVSNVTAELVRLSIMLPVS